MTVNVTVEDGIARVALDAPPLNILTRGVLQELREHLSDLEGDPTLRALLLGAEGRHFSAGASVEEHLPPEYEAMIPEFVETVEALWTFPLPVVAMVRGRCLGGAFELVQACDLVVASDDALFGLPEIQLAVFPPAACALLPRLVGSARAAEIVFTGDPLDAEAAARAGLVSRVVGDHRLEVEARRLAARIARHSGAALRRAKRALRAAVEHPGRGMARATEIYTDDLMGTADAVEGLTAFVEKRKPEWSHR